MAEALAVIGIVANIAQLISVGSYILRRLEEYRNGPKKVHESFNRIIIELPALLDALRQIELAVNGRKIPSGTETILVPVLESCKTKIMFLDRLIEKALPNSNDTWRKRRRKAIYSLWYDAKVEETTAVIQSYIKTLTFHAVASLLYMDRLAAGHVDTRWTYFQAPYVFEDALGRTYPIPSEYDPLLIRHVIKGKFLGMPGYRQVLLGNYELFLSQRPQQKIISITDIRPGTAITMAMILNSPDDAAICCPMPHCRSTVVNQKEFGGVECSKCKICFDMSQQKRKSFSDVARIAKPSEFEWLVDNIETMSLSEASYLNFSKVSSYPEDLKAYKNVRLSIRDRIEASDFTLEDDVGYDMYPFNRAAQIGLAHIFRSYDRGILEKHDVSDRIIQLFDDENLKIEVNVFRARGEALDTIVFTMSSAQLSTEVEEESSEIASDDFAWEAETDE